MGPSLKTVAEEAGVSVATVNQILNGHTHRFAADTCVLVQATAASVGYQPNLAARALRQNKSFLLGVLFSDGNATLFSDFARGIMKGLGQQDYSPIVFSSRNTIEELACLDRCLRRRVDGLIVNVSVDPDGETNEGRLCELQASGLPMVQVFGRFLPGVPKVSVGIRETARMSVECLTALGHRSIALITHDQYNLARDTGAGLHFDAWEQVEGYEHALRAAGGTPVVVTQSLQTVAEAGDIFTQMGHDAIEELMALTPTPTAVICYNDDIAWGVCQSCRERGIDVPHDLAVIGYGDDKSSRLSSPPLTTFRRPVAEIAKAATQLLLGLIEDKEMEDRVLVPKLVVRASTGGGEVDSEK